MLELHADLEEAATTLNFNLKSTAGVKPDAIVGLFVYTGRQGEPFICGPIGKGAKFCVDPSCDVDSHKTKAKKNGLPPFGVYLMTDVHTILREPFLSIEKYQFFRRVLSNILNEDLPYAGAVGLIFALNSVFASGMPNKQKLAEASSYVESLVENMTSGKPRGLSPSKPVIETEDDVNSLLDDVEAEKAYKKKVMGELEALQELKRSIRYEQGITNGLIGTPLQPELPINSRLDDLTSGTERLAQDLLSVKLDHSQLQTEFQSSLVTQDERHTNQDHRLIKVESSAQGAASNVTKLSKGLKKILTMVEQLASNQKLRNGVDGFPRSAGPARQIEDASQPHSSSSAPSSAPAVDLTPLQKQLDDLAEALRAVQRRSDYISLESGTTEFYSRAELGTVFEGMGIKEALEFIWLICSDPVNLIQRLMQDTVSGEQVRNEQIHEQKTGWSDNQTKFLIASRCIIPEIFAGGATSQSTATGRMELTAISTHLKFDGGNGNDGVYNFIKKQLNRVKGDLERLIDRNLAGHPELISLAKGNVKRSYTFVLDLLRFMNEQYSELLQKCYGEGPFTKAQKADIWDLMLLMFRVVWETLWETRQVAQNAHTDPSTAALVYLESALKTHMQMEIFMDKGFIEHSGIFPKLTRHLFESTVSKESFDSLKTRFDSVASELQETKRKLDRLETRLDAYIRGGGGGGGGDDDAGGNAGLSKTQRKKMRKALAAAKTQEDEDE